jgi:hypothetical protein
MIHLQVTVDNAAELLDTNAYGAGALLRWESGTSLAGPFTEGATLPLVASQTVYDVWDPNGTETTWYRTRTSNSASTSFSEYSNIAPPAPVPYTYDVTTDLGKVRLLCQDFDMTNPIFTDAEIQAFMDLNDDTVRYAAAQALFVIGASEAYIMKRITTLSLSTDGPAVAKELRELAKEYIRQEDEPAGADGWDYAEQVYDTFSAREVLRNAALRGEI